jgi:hypothetical protein
MSNDLKIGALIIVAILITITALIVASVYNNNQNVARDKYYADHCKSVSVETSPDSNSKIYECAK